MAYTHTLRNVRKQLDRDRNSIQGHPEHDVSLYQLEKDAPPLYDAIRESQPLCKVGCGNCIRFQGISPVFSPLCDQGQLRVLSYQPEKSVEWTNGL